MVTASLTGVRQITKNTLQTIYIKCKTLACSECLCASISYTYMSVHTHELVTWGEALCGEVRCCFICFFYTRFAVHLRYIRWKGVPCTRGSVWYCTIRWICSGHGDCEKTPGGMSGGVSVCVSDVSKLTMQRTWNFKPINVSYKNKKWHSQSFLNSWPRETGLHNINILPLNTIRCAALFWASCSLTVSFLAALNHMTGQ